MNIMQLIMNILASGFAGDHMEQDAQTIAPFFSCFSFKQSAQFVTIYYNSAIAMPALSM